MSDVEIPEVVYGPQADTRQAPLTLVSKGVQRLVWHMRYCDILIEIRDGVGMACGHADPEEKGLRQPIGRRCEPIWTVKTVPLSIT